MSVRHLYAGDVDICVYHVYYFIAEERSVSIFMFKNGRGFFSFYLKKNSFWFTYHKHWLDGVDINYSIFTSNLASILHPLIHICTYKRTDNIHLQTIIFVTHRRPYELI